MSARLQHKPVSCFTPAPEDRTADLSEFGPVAAGLVAIYQARHSRPEFYPVADTADMVTGAGRNFTIVRFGADGEQYECLTWDGEDWLGPVVTFEDGAPAQCETCGDIAGDPCLHGRACVAAKGYGL